MLVFDLDEYSSIHIYVIMSIDSSWVSNLRLPTKTRAYATHLWLINGRAQAFSC